MKYTKNYSIIFDTWSERSFNREQHDFDTIKEAKAYSLLIEEIYQNTQETTDSHGNLKTWGYVILDVKNSKVVKWGGPNRSIFNINSKRNQLEVKDFFFRREDEIPKNYKWDIGEYEGWLQFRWGDGRNAINYNENLSENKPNKKLPHLIKENDIEEVLQYIFDEKQSQQKIKNKRNNW